MHENTKTCLHQAEGGHQFCGACERAAELCFEHTQNGGNESSCMANTDPKHSVDEENTPIRGSVDACNAEAFHDHFCPCINQAIRHNRTQHREYSPELPGSCVHGFHDHLIHLTAWKRIQH